MECKCCPRGCKADRDRFTGFCGLYYLYKSFLIFCKKSFTNPSFYAKIFFVPTTGLKVSPQKLTFCAGFGEILIF